MKTATFFIIFLSIFSCKRENTNKLPDINAEKHHVEKIEYQEKDFSKEILKIDDVSFPFCVEVPKKVGIYYNIWWCYKKYDSDLDIPIIDIKES